MVPNLLMPYVYSVNNVVAHMVRQCFCMLSFKLMLEMLSLPHEEDLLDGHMSTYVPSQYDARLDDEVCLQYIYGVHLNVKCLRSFSVFVSKYAKWSVFRIVKQNETWESGILGTFNNEFLVFDDVLWCFGAFASKCPVTQKGWL